MHSAIARCRVSYIEDGHNLLVRKGRQHPESAGFGCALPKPSRPKHLALLLRTPYHPRFEVDRFCVKKSGRVRGLVCGIQVDC